tara:strand:+ start:362 stop:535 length:174 start_codon:yes stop_codon:yes gene_type:complete
MKHPKHIMRAIDLMQANKVKDELPWWLIPLDYTLTFVYLGVFFGVCVFLLKTLLSWL